MKTFFWQGYDKQKQAQSGRITAATKNIARLLLRQMDLQTIRIIDTPRLTRNNQMLILAELAPLLKSAMPLNTALEALQKTYPSMHPALQMIRDDLNEGLALSAALKRQQFSHATIQLIQTGEKTGRLESLLDTINTHQQALHHHQKTLKKACFYPGFVGVMSLLVFALMLWLVVPHFAKLFADFHATLPALTRGVIALSQHLLIIFIGLLISISVILVLRKTRFSLKPFLQQAPLLSPIFKAIELAQLCTILSTFLQAGISLSTALTDLQSAAQTKLASALRVWHRHIEQGAKLSQALKMTPWIPERIIQFVTLAEYTGDLSRALATLGEYYTHLADEKLSRLTQLIEPLMMIVLGCGLGSIVVALYLPLFYLGRAIG